MPRVPTQDSFRVTPGNAPTGRSSLGFEGRGAREALRDLNQAGEELTQVGAQMINQEVRQLEHFNRLRVMDAENRLAPLEAKLRFDPNEGFLNRKGDKAFMNAEGVPLDQEFAQKFDEEAGNIAASLGNGAQRQAFEMRAAQRKAQLLSDITSHYGREAVNYEDSVYEGTILRRQDELPNLANNPDAFRAAIGTPDDPESLMGAAAARRRLRGEADGTARLMAEDDAGKAIAGVIRGAIDRGDADVAEALYYTYHDQLGASAVQLERPMRILKDTKMGQQAATTAATQMQWRTDMSEAGRLHRLLLQQESSQMQFKNGQVVTSRTGKHFGIGQMSEEAGIDAAKALGVPFDMERLKNDENYNASLSRKYMELKLKETGGDIRAALASYNWGFGNVGAAMAKAKVAGGDWLQYTPKETQDYVTKIMAGYNQGTDWTEKRPTAAEMIRAAVAALPPDASPEAQQNARELIEKQYKAFEEERKQSSERAQEQALTEMRDNGKAWADLPAPLRAAIPAAERDSLLAAVNNREDTPEGYRLYNALVTNPTQVERMSQSDIYKLGRVMSQPKVDELLAIHRGTSKTAYETKAAVESANKVMLEAGIAGATATRPGKDADAEDMVRVGMLRDFATEAVRAQQRATGKPMDQAQTDAFVRQVLLRKMQTSSAGPLGLPTGIFSRDAKAAEKPLIEMKYRNIPRATRDSIKKSLVARNPELEPTEVDVLREFMRMSLIRPRQKTESK